MLRFGTGGQFVGEGGEERERPLRIAFVLRQMERHLADQMGERIDFAEPVGGPLGIGCRGLGDQRGEFRPACFKQLGRQVFEPDHRRRGLNKLNQFLPRGRRQCPPVFSWLVLGLA